MSRILHHVGSKDFRRTRQRQIGEQKEYAAQKLKEWQEVESERKQIEEAAKPYKSNWRKELQESDWTSTSGPGPTNSASQSFVYPGGTTVTVSGLGGIEGTPSTVTVDQFGDVFDVDAPNYSQLALQGYAPMLQIQKRGNQTEDERIDAEIRKLEAQIKESKAKETAAIDAWNAELLATMNRHGREWEAVLKKDGVYNPEKHKGLQARHDAEIEAIWSKEPKTEPYETERQNLRAKIAELEKQRPINQQLDASQQVAQTKNTDVFMGARVQPAVPAALSDYRNVPLKTVGELVAKDFGVTTAKNFIDHYADNFVYGDGKQDQNLTNLMTSSDKKWLTNALAQQKEFSDPRPLDNHQDAVDRVLERGDAPLGIRMSIGNGSKIDMDYYRKTGNIKLDKDYVFTEPDDFGARSDSNVRSRLMSIGTVSYARIKAGGHPFADASNFIQNPMRFHVIIPGPKRKKKEEEEEMKTESTTWSRLQKYR